MTTLDDRRTLIEQPSLPPVAFHDGAGFWKETWAVVAGALACGVAAPFVVAGVPLAVAAGAGALFGGSVGAALTRERPRSRLGRAALGLFGGALTALGYAAWATAMPGNALLAGALGAATLGALLSSTGSKSGGATLLGLGATAAAGAVGADALTHIAAFTASEGAPVALSSAVMSGGFALWVTAAAGLRRLERPRDPLRVRAEQVLTALKEPLRARVVDGVAQWDELEASLQNESGLIDTTLVADARAHGRTLLVAVLETATSAQNVVSDLESPRLTGIEARIADVERRRSETQDEIALAHLARADAALVAQRAAIAGLKVARDRAEGALEAQLALLSRLHLAVLQHKTSDRERFALEIGAVADQVSRLSDDLDSLSAALAEAEALGDRRVLAEAERVGRRALGDLVQAVEHHADERVVVESKSS